MKRTLIAFPAVAVAAAALAGAASAHVSVHPNVLPSGGFVAVDVRVPNERPKASTVKVDVKVPSGIYFLSYQPVPGWKAVVLYAKLAAPVTVFGEKITQQVDRVVFTGHGSAGRIAPGQFLEFPLSLAMPKAKTGTALAFKALQTYSNGEVVRWIGAPGADAPAPQVLVADAGAPAVDYPAGVDAARKARKTQSAGAPALGGLVLGLPLAGLAGLGLAVRRRRARA